MLGLLALSELLMTDEFWVPADAQATTGDDWGIGIDMVAPGRPHLHCPAGIADALLGGDAALPTQWYRADTGLFLERQSPASPERDYGFDIATHTTLTPYLPSQAGLRTL